MPRWKAEAKKREEEKKAGAKKPQSSSVKNVNKKAQNSTFMGGGTSVKKAEKTYTAAKRPSAKARQVAEEQKRRRELEQRQNQKMYGDQKRTTPRRTTSTSNNLTQHTTAAQRQKMGMPTAEDLRNAKEHRRQLANSVKNSVRSATSEENKSFMQRQKSGIQTEADRQYSEKLNQRRAEVAKNTGRAATKGVQDTLTGYGKTLADVDEMAKSNKNWTRAKASKMGISEDDTVGMAKVEGERQKSIKQAQELRRDLAEKQDKRQADWDERTKNAKGLEKAWYGAVESGTGMATDALVGALTGTGTAGSLASMAVRTYGTTRGQAEKEGATENEDRAYAVLQAAKEVGTELMFPGAGLAKKTYGKVGLSVADRVANKLTKGLTGSSADLVGAGVRLLGGTAEENAEEFAGWGLDPVIKELAYGKKVRTREAQKLLKQESDELRSNLKSADDARSVAAYLGSDRFLADNIAQYKDAGLSDKQAREVAEKMRDYLTASLTGDTDRMGDLEDEIVTTVAGGSLKAMIKEYDKGELIDTFASTSVLTLATGLPATATTAMKGARIRENLGSEGLRALSQTAINFEDDEASLKGQAARDRLDSGKDLTSTQVFDLAKAQAEQIEKDEKRVAAMSNMADNAIKSEKLVTPKIGFRENGSVTGDEIITMNYVNESNNATEIISDLMKEEGSESLTDTEVQTGSRAIAGFKTGAFTVNDANALNYTNTTVRTAFETATGVNLSQYVVRKNGQVDIPATNAATKDALFAMAADNFVKTAQAETANWMDSVKGDVVTQVTERMGAQGSLALQQALDDVDERDRSTYMMNANAADMMYQTARNMGTEWDSVKAEARRMFPNISETKLEAMYNAGLRDRADAANGAIGQQVRMGETMALQNEPSEPKGKVFVDTTATPKGTVVRTFSEIASNLGVDIHLVDDLKTSTGGQANGQYVNGAIYINMNSDFESNIGYIFMHEVTHHLKQYAPEQFNELENLVREKWFGYNPEQMQNEIAKKIDLYKRNGQTLSEEEALEEIIADAAHEFLNDGNFAKQVAEDNPSVAKAILDGIKSVLRKFRQIIALGYFDDETHMANLFSQLDILDEAEKLWLNAYTQAVQNKAAVAIDEWQDRANRASISTTNDVLADRDDTAIFIKNTADADYIDMIFSGEKTEETRTRRTLDAFIGKEVAVTDGKNVYGTVVLGEPHKYSAEEFRSKEAQAKHRVPIGDTYDSANGKWAYPIESYERYDEPRKLSDSKDYLNTRQARQVRFSITTQQDADYMKAVKAGDMETAQRMVDEAALQMPNVAKATKGRMTKPLKLYHGTRYFGFTQFRDDLHDVPFIYTSTDRTVSAHYAGDQHYASTRPIGKPYREGDSIDDIIENAKTVWQTNYHVMTSDEKKARYNEVIDEAKKIADKIDEFDVPFDSFADGDDYSFANAVDNVKYLFWIARDMDDEYYYNFDEDNGYREDSVQYHQDAVDGFERNIERVREYYHENRSNLSDEQKRLLSYLIGYEVGDAAIDMRSVLKVMTEEDRLMNEYGYGRVPSEMKETLDSIHNIAAYELYGDLGERPFEFDANGAQFYGVKVPEMGDGYYSTDAICKWAYENGYTSVIMHNIYDYGDKADNYVFFSSSQLKSADTITYAEDGSVIPLSERFDPTNNDIRYSLPTTDADGNVLTDGQMEYFKNSQARDAEGRLVPVYHATSQGGFTVFDPMRSDDHRSLFFSNKKDVANTYVERFLITGEDKLGGEELDNQEGYYQVYLNLENPLIIEGNGQEWDAISIDTKLPKDCHLELYTSEYLLDKAKYDDYLYGIGQSRRDGSKPREYGNNAKKNGEVVLKFETGEWVPVKESQDAIAKAINEHYGIEENDPTGAILAESFLSDIQAKGRIEYQKWLNESLMKEMTSETHNTRDWAEIAQQQGYDGVIFFDIIDMGQNAYDIIPSDIYVAFSSNQVKDVDNENPTENPDIRYSIATRDEVSGYLMQKAESITDIPLQDASLEDNRIRYSLDATNFENSIVSEWGRRKRNLADDVKDTPLRRSLIRLMKQVRTDSGEDKQYSTETIDETIRSLKKMYYYAKGDKAKDFAREAWDAAERIVGDINYNDVQYLHYKGISNYFADTEIHAPEELIDDDTFIQFAKTNAGRIRLFADKGIEIEEAWKSLHDAHPDLFPRAAFVADSPVGMLIQMDWVLNQLAPYKEAYTSEEHSKLVEDIANTLCSIVEEGNEYNATVNDLNVRAMRQRHAEALRKVQEQEKQKRDNQKERAEKWKQKYLERVAKNKADKEAGRQKKNETKLVGDIEKNIKWLSDRLRPETRTKDNAIPEQFRSALGALLAEFDLQSKGSKKIEKKKGYPSKTTLKLKQLREQYAAIAKENDDDGNNVFRYNGDLLVKMDELIKTMESLDKFFDKHYGREVTIADLSLSEMFVIDTMLKSLVHEFREYKNVTIDSKRAEIAGVSSEVIGDMDTQIGRHGAAREGGALGKINGLLNMSEVTPIYFFKRLGAMYKMYRELRKGFDKYIENDREVIKRLSEIMSGYYNKKNPGTTIESWRTAEDAQTFNFEHGPITLSVAQMMEVYLYANRPQAFGHMIGDGIIVTPISPVGKIESAKEKLLGHEPMVDPVRLTYENVQEIISKLSTEQVNMANKLQELVAGYMSDLGNETTMKLYGYKMFDDPNYFGIHVSQTATNSSVDAPAITETIKNFGWTKPLTPGARNTIVIGDIFTDVARYCNEMNQFNAYAVPVSDFMRVYNYKLRDENGDLKGSAKSAIIKAFGNQAHTYIMNFLRDLNGSSMRRNGGLEGLIDAALGRAKKAAVFMNMRVALQQPTAIVRALAQIKARYFVGVRPSAAATKEMIEHCPIAQWKAWGFYDTHFGRDVEDLIMNNWSKADVVGSWIYGALDNMTWGMIWQAVKNEVDADIKKRGLNVEKGSQKYWDMCNDRASEVFDSTQVVDSPFHRSDAMRSKDTLVKQFTSFQAEPTLSFNVIRDFAVQAYDAVADGDKTKAAKLIAKGAEVWTLQAAVVAVAQSLWDAVRHKDPDGDDDEDEGFLELWWQNFMADFVDDLKFYNNIYFLKEFTPYAEKLVDYMKTGKWDTYDSNKLLMFQGAEKMTQGLQQLIKKIQKGDEYKHKNGEPYTWYEVMTNFLGGVGYLTGMPIGTVMRDAQSILKWFHINAFAADGTEQTKPSLTDAIANKMGYRKREEPSGDTEESKADSADIDAKLKDYEESLSDTYTDKQKKSLVKQYKKTLEKEAVTEAAMSEDFDVQAHIAEAQANFDYEMEKRSIKAAEMAAGKTGRQRDEALWDVISEGYTKSVESGNMATIQRMREEFAKQGGDTEWFDAKIADKMKSAYKKTIYSSDEIVPGASLRQETMYNFMTEHGVSEKEISDIVYHSYVARDLKAAMRIGNEDYIMDELVPLVAAGLSREDYEKLYKYRNMGAKTYDGKYTDPKYTKTTGTFVWPTEGVITSHFGYRNAPTAGASSNHPAIDIGAPSGTTVVAADGGVVIYAGSNGGYGNSVGVKHANGMVTYYNHLSGWNVKVGDQVAQGQPIANVGSTGISTGPHLDFKILDADGNPVDPEKYLNKRS